MTFWPDGFISIPNLDHSKIGPLTVPPVPRFILLQAEISNMLDTLVSLPSVFSDCNSEKYRAFGGKALSALEQTLNSCFFGRWAEGGRLTEWGDTSPWALLPLPGRPRRFWWGPGTGTRWAARDAPACVCVFCPHRGQSQCRAPPVTRKFSSDGINHLAWQQ